MLLINPVIKSESKVKHLIVKFLPENFMDMLFVKFFISSYEKSKILLHPAILISLFPLTSIIDSSVAKLIGELLIKLNILFALSFTMVIVFITNT